MKRKERNKLGADGHGYILRYYLPVKPNFEEAFTEKRFQELLRFCKTAKVNAVMFYVALDPDFYYMPESVLYAQSQKEQMLPYIKRLREAGIGYQINFQNLLGAQTAGADFSDRLPWESLVDQYGRKVSCGCPLGKQFREQTAQRLAIWAETRPDVLWIDDDFRLHGHGAHVLAAQEGKSAYVDYYCFCDEHIARFNERHATSYTREGLVAEILREGTPSWARVAYLDFLLETMTETAAWIRECVQTVSPETKLAQMTSGPNSHAAEGRIWGDFLTALTGKQSPILRPTFGPYHEYNPLDFASSYALLSQLRAQLRESYVGEVEYCPEIENTRFTVWSKSAAATAYQLALSAFMGCKETTLSLHDLEGGAFFDEPAYTKMLKKQKVFLDRLTRLDLKNCREIGVQIPTSERGGRYYNARKNANFGVLRGGESYIQSYLLKMGIPCAYVNFSEIDASKAVALDAYSANILPDEQLKSILSGRVFLEGGAVEKLLERGYGEAIGVKRVMAQKVCVQSEIFLGRARVDGTYIRVPSRIPAYAWLTAEFEEGVEALANFVAPKGERTPSLLRYENKWGGQVAVYLAKSDFGDGFFTHHRVALWKDLFGWLDSTLPRLDATAYTLFAVRETKDKKQYCLVANLSADRAHRYVINGKAVKETLDLYQTAVYEIKGEKRKRIGKTKAL